MSIGVSHSYAGNVVVVDMASGRRWDLSADQAEASCERLDAAIALGAHGLVVMACLDGRSFRYSGAVAEMEKMAADLREHAAAARARRWP